MQKVQAEGISEKLQLCANFLKIWCVEEIGQEILQKWGQNA